MEMQKICNIVNYNPRVAGANFMNSLMKYIKVNVFVVEYPGYGIYQYN